jgi:MFS family permease
MGARVTARVTAPLRRRPFAWYFAARLVSVAGTAMAPIALAFAVLDITDTPGALGRVLASFSVPMLVFLLVGGVLSDRLPRIAVMRVSHLVQGITQTLAAALVISGEARVWQLMLLGAVSGTATALAMPALRSVVPQLVPPDDLQQANLLLSVTRGAVAVAGPSVAALLVVGAGPGWALAVDAATALTAAVLLGRVGVVRRVEAAPRTGLWRDLGDGWRQLGSIPWFWIVVIAFAAMNAIQAGAWTTLGPVLAKDTIGERGWGLALSGLALGLLVGAIALMGVPLRRPLLVGMIAIAATGTPILVLGIDPRVIPLVAATFVAGVGVEVFTLGWHLAIQENVPEHLLSRAYSWDQLGSFAVLPVGQLAAGPLAATFGLRQVITVGGIVYVGLALATLLSPAVRGVTREPVTPSTTASPAS